MLSVKRSIAALAALLAAGMLLLALAPVPVQAAGKNLDAFAKCLAAKPVTMYGTFWCPHCYEQKQLFGTSFRYVKYVECGIKGTHQITNQCKAMGLSRTPTWVFPDGTRLEGTQPLEKLAQQSGCKLP